MLYLMLVAALLQPCPTARGVRGMEVFKVPAGCSAPTTVWAYTPKAYADNAAELSGLEVLLTGARAERDKCRSKRTETATGCAEQTDEDANLIKQLTNQVEQLELSRPDRRVWLGVGAVLGAAVVGGIWAVESR